MHRSTIYLATLFLAGLILTAPTASAQSARSAAPAQAAPAQAAPAQAASATSSKATDGASQRRPATAAPDYSHPAVQNRGGLTFYATRADFDAANPGLSVEDFEDVNVAPSSFCASFSPVDSNTDDACYDPGTLPAGLAIAAVGPSSTLSDAIVALGSGFFGNPSTVVGANYFSDNTELRFASGTAAVGTDVLAFFGGGTTTVEVYDTADNLLGTTTLPATTTAQFLGVRSDDAAIGRIQFVLLNDDTFVDNLAFGGGSGPTCDIEFVNADLLYDAGTRRLTVDVTVTNTGASSSGASLELDYNRNGGAPQGTRVLGSGTLPSGATVSRTLSIPVPGAAPDGNYNFDLRLVDPGTGGDCDSYQETIAISAPRVAGDAAAGELFEVEAMVDLTPTASAVTGATAAVSPNPFAQQTTIRYEVSATSDVRLAVYDVLGREVAVVVDSRQEAGAHAATFDARGLAAGTYVYRLVVGNDVQTGRMTLAH